MPAAVKYAGKMLVSSLQLGKKKQKKKNNQPNKQTNKQTKIND
jgi:hypothetical protein